MTAPETSAKRATKRADKPAEPPPPQPAERHPYGPRPLAALIPPLTRATWRRQGPATAQVLADWETIIGPALAAVTLPRRLSAGTLTLACSGPIATELQHLTGQLIERINHALATKAGQKPVERIRFVQDLRTRPTSSATPAPEAPAPDLPGLAPGPVRDALASLGQAIGASTPATRDPKL